MDRAGFLRGVCGGAFAAVTAREAEAELSTVPAELVNAVADGNIVIAYMDGPDEAPVIFARESKVNMHDLVAAGPGSIVRFR